MKVIVDTSVWSLALRRSRAQVSPYRDLLEETLRDGRVVMLGVIRQELLSGVRHAGQFDRLQRHLRAFPDLPMETEDYELAAVFYNSCMSMGVRGSHIDFLICACAHRRKQATLTTDPDFRHYQKHIPVALLEP